VLFIVVKELCFFGTQFSNLWIARALWCIAKLVLFPERRKAATVYVSEKKNHQ